MIYIKREIEKEIRTLAKEFPVLTIMGPRQSGKTTLAKHLFPKHTYVSLENIDMREFASSDPHGFFDKYSKNIIIDEIQKVPALFSYLQTHSDNLNTNGNFVITGSQNYLLLEKVSQSLAGRVGLATLLPFSLDEIEKIQKIKNPSEVMFNGTYPRLYSQKIRPAVFYDSYINTYLEKDVRQITNIKDFDVFRKFLVVLAGRSGQILNVSSIAAECGLSRATIDEWLNILEASFIIFRLRPFYKNYKKQVIKSPKIFFYDTGIVCSLLGITSVEQVDRHYLKGNIFETFVINEFVKNNCNFSKQKNFFYWRDSKGREVDLIVEHNLDIHGIEIKSSKTIKNSFFDNLNYWSALDKTKTKKYIVYTGEETYVRDSTKIVNWKKLKI